MAADSDLFQFYGLEAAPPVQSTALATIPSDAGSLVVKDTTEPMTMSELGEWFEQFGNSGWRKALREVAFMACCDVIAQDAAKSTLRLRRRTSAKTSEIVMPNRHPMAAMLADQPNPWHTWYEFTEMSVLWHVMQSNSYAGVIRSMTDDVLQMIPLRSDGQVYRKIAGGKLFYDVSASTIEDELHLGSRFRTFRQEDMIHVRGRLIDGMDGYSTLVAGREALDIAASIGKFRGNLFSEEGQYRGVFTRDNTEPLPNEIFDRLRQQYKVMMNKFRKLVEPIVLEGGLKFSAVASNPKEIELVAEFEAQITEMCRLTRVPPHKIFQLAGAKYENLETQEKMYVGDTLIPVCERHEQKYGHVLLTRKERQEFFFEYDREEMTLRDPKNETDRVIRAVERGILEVDEGRAVLGFNQLPNNQGQVRLIPVNMNVVDRDGEVIIGGQAGKEEPKPDDAPTEDKPATDEAKKALRLVHTQ